MIIYEKQFYSNLYRKYINADDATMFSNKEDFEKILICANRYSKIRKRYFSNIFSLIIIKYK